MKELFNHKLLKQQSKSLYWWKEGLLPLSYDWEMCSNPVDNHIRNEVVAISGREFILSIGQYAHSRYKCLTKAWPESNDSFIFEI